MKKLTKKKKLEIVEKYLCGKSVLNLSKEYNLSKSTIYSFIKKHHEEICNHPVNLRDFTILNKMHERKKTYCPYFANCPLHGKCTLKRKITSN